MATDRPRVGVSDERIRVLRSVELFEGLGLDAISELGLLVSEQEQTPGAILASDEAGPGGLWVVVQGSVELRRSPANQHRIGTLGVVGEWELLGERRWVGELRCTQRARLLFLAQEAWEELAFRRPDIHLEVLQNFVRALCNRRGSAESGSEMPPLFCGDAKS